MRQEQPYPHAGVSEMVFPGTEEGLANKGSPSLCFQTARLLLPLLSFLL